MSKRVIATIVVGVLVIPAAAVLAQPGAIPPVFQPVHATQLPALNCSIGTFGPSYVINGINYEAEYGVSASCAGGGGSKSVTVNLQIAAANGSWLEKSGSSLTVNGALRTPLRVDGWIPVNAGRSLRTCVVGSITKNGQTGHADFCGPAEAVPNYAQ